jgi:hypothetical protein
VTSTCYFSMRKYYRGLKFIIVLAILTISFTGCLDKQFAKWQMGSVEKLILKAKDYQADVYAPDLLKQTQDAFNKASQLYNAGNYKDARAIIKTAATLAKTLFDTTRQRKADADFELADKKFRIATDNEGRKYNPQLYDQIKLSLDRLRNYHSKKSYDKTIQYAKEVITGVANLLKDVIDTANKYVNDAKNKLEDARVDEAEIRAPDAWLKAKDAVAESDKMLTQDKYIIATDKAKAALILAENADNRALESKARDEVANAEKLMLALEEANAQKYVTLEYKAVKDHFATAWSAFNSQDFKVAVQVAKMVENEAPSVLAKAEKLRLKELLETAAKNIDKVRANDGEKYAPTFLAEAQAIYDAANTAYQASEYEQVKKLIDDIANKIDRANDQLRLRASDEIQKAAIAINDAQDAQATIYAGEILATAISFRTLAEKELENKEYRNAIVTAQATIEKAQEAKMAAIKRNAEISLIAAEKEISRTVGEGGDLYAVDEMKEARALLTSGKEALTAQQYTKAIDIAGQVESKCAEAITTIRSKAIAKINETNNTIANVEEGKYLVAKYAPELLRQAKVLVDDANVKLTAKRYNLALEGAIDSQNVAISAKNKSIRQQIIDRTPSVQQQIDEAKIAGAYGYAIEEYDKALSKLSAAQTDLQAGKFDLALQDINDAELAAQGALNGQINKAETAVATAKEVGAWKYEPTSLQVAVVQLDLAQKEMKAKNYPESLRAATASLMAADKASVDTKNKIVSYQVEQLYTRLSNAQIANAFIPDRVASLRDRTRIAEQRYRKQGATSYLSTIEVLDKLKTEIDGLDKNAKDAKDKETEKINTFLAAEIKQGAKEFAEQEIQQATESLRLLDFAYAQKNYPQAKMYLDQANNAVKTIKLRRAENDYKLALAQQLDRWNKAMGDFDSVIRLSPYYLKNLKGTELADAYKATDPSFNRVMSLSKPVARGIQSDAKTDPYKGIIGSNMSSAKFKQVMIDLDTNVKKLNPPPTLRELHALVLSAFNEAKIAADYFDKFGFSAQFSADTRNEFIDLAFKNIESAWSKKSEIDLTLYGPQSGKKSLKSIVINLPKILKNN